MKTLNEMLENQMQDEKFRKEYEEMQPEFDVIRAIVDARTSQNLTQKELSEFRFPLLKAVQQAPAMRTINMYSVTI